MKEASTVAPGGGSNSSPCQCSTVEEEARWPTSASVGAWTATGAQSIDFTGAGQTVVPSVLARSCEPRQDAKHR